MGALDVCPFIPVRGVTMDECVLCAQAFGQRLAEELGVPGACLGKGGLSQGLPQPAPPHFTSVPISSNSSHPLRFSALASLKMRFKKKTPKHYHAGF